VSGAVWIHSLRYPERRATLRRLRTFNDEWRRSAAAPPRPSFPSRFCQSLVLHEYSCLFLAESNFFPLAPPASPFKLSSADFRPLAAGSRSSAFLRFLIDFALSPEQCNLVQQASSFVSTVLPATRAAYLNEETFHARLLHEQAVMAGFIKGSIPKTFGGTATSMIDTALV
jgi:hypothetical protein